MVAGQAWRRSLLASGAVAALMAIGGPAQAGGFAVREQSTEFQGMSFAGSAAAGGGLSGMFWNPAAAAFAPVGIYMESHAAVIFGNSEITGDLFNAAGTNVGPALGLGRNSGDIAKDAIVPSSYMSYRLSEQMVLAMSINSPFGLVTEPSNRLYTGATFARTSEIKTYNFTPTLAYRVSPTIAIGVGLQIEHIEGRLKQAFNVNAAGIQQNVVVQGDDTSFGFTAGINFTPSKSTQIGLGYRSSIDHTLEGTVFAPNAQAAAFGSAGAAALASLGAGIKAGTTLPEIVTFGLRQMVNDRLTLLGTVEWTNWSRLQKLDVKCANTAANAVYCPLGNGQTVSTLDFAWHDGWFFSIGGEYKYTERLTLRTGLGYEISPVRNAVERPHAVPDADRIWASLGATYKWSEAMSLDFAYTHIFVDDAPMDRTDRLPDGRGGTNTFRFLGSADTSVDIVSASLKIKLGGGEAHAPMK